MTAIEASAGNGDLGRIIRLEERMKTAERDLARIDQKMAYNEDSIAKHLLESPSKLEFKEMVQTLREEAREAFSEAGRSTRAQAHEIEKNTEWRLRAKGAIIGAAAVGALVGNLIPLILRFITW